MDDEFETTESTETPDQIIDEGPTDDELEALRVEVDLLRSERDQALSDQNSATAELIGRLREVLLASEPAVAPDLVRGDTLAELEASFAAAKETVDRVRDQVRSERHNAGIGGGAPGRLTTGPATPREKIRAGLARREG